MAQNVDIEKEWNEDKERFIEDILWDIRKTVGICVREIALNNTEPLVVLGKIKPILAQHNATEEKIKGNINYLVERLKEKK